MLRRIRVSLKPPVGPPSWFVLRQLLYSRIKVQHHRQRGVILTQWVALRKVSCSEGATAFARVRQLTIYIGADV